MFLIVGPQTWCLKQLRADFHFEKCLMVVKTILGNIFIHFVSHKGQFTRIGVILHSPNDRPGPGKIKVSAKVYGSLTSNNQ